MLTHNGFARLLKRILTYKNKNMNTNEKLSAVAMEQSCKSGVMQSVSFNELRTGNYIQFSSGSVYSVDIIYKDYTMLKNWFAIPLNDEWLKILGFDFDEEERVFQKLDIRIELVDGDFIFNYGYGLKYIKYVHELQNIFFTLTDIELTVA